MRQLFLVLSTIAWFMLAASPARASNCATDQYDHNGSVMEFHVCDGGAITISYLNPRSGMARQGVRSGTLLFDGQSGANGQIFGNARLFSARCGVITYPVSGRQQGNSIILRGTAPVRGSNCRIAKHRQDTLVFTLMAAGPPVVQPSCPAGYVLSGGQCVLAGPAPAPAPQPGGGDWYAIAGSFGKQGQAQARVGQLGGGAWFIMNTRQCPNFRNGYWIATAGPFAKGQAQAFAAQAGRFGAYVKSCH